MLPPMLLLYMPCFNLDKNRLKKEIVTPFRRPDTSILDGECQSNTFTAQPKYGQGRMKLKLPSARPALRPQNRSRLRSSFRSPNPRPLQLRPRHLLWRTSRRTLKHPSASTLRTTTLAWEHVTFDPDIVGFWISHQKRGRFSVQRICRVWVS